MDLSLGFIVVLILILFPGLIFRRLYFYGQFSKEFKSSYNLISLLAVSTIPGIINLICVFIFYDNIFSEIDIGEIIDKFKDINNPLFKLTESNDTPIKNLISSKASPFIAFLYLSSILSGALLGRFIRITNLDIKFKLLRFKNYWFYLFNGQPIALKKLDNSDKKNKKHLFTKADILIDTNSENILYSGILVDYELLDNSCKKLSKVMLKNAKRYNLTNGKRTPVQIPGNTMIVDCLYMKNINLTYIYEQTKSILESRLPNIIDVVFSLIILLLIPLFIFKADGINLNIYNTYFDLRWYEKFLVYLLTIQSINILNPFVKKDNFYRFVNWKSIIAKLVWIIILLLILWLLLK